MLASTSGKLARETFQTLWLLVALTRKCVLVSDALHWRWMGAELSLLHTERKVDLCAFGTSEMRVAPCQSVKMSPRQSSGVLSRHILSMLTEVGQRYILRLITRPLLIIFIFPILLPFIYRSITHLQPGKKKKLVNGGMDPSSRTWRRAGPWFLSFDRI